MKLEEITIKIIKVVNYAGGQSGAVNIRKMIIKTAKEIYESIDKCAKEGHTCDNFDMSEDDNCLICNPELKDTQKI